MGSSLAFTLKEGPVRCAKVCNKSWVILRCYCGAQTELQKSERYLLILLCASKFEFVKSQDLFGVARSLLTESWKITVSKEYKEEAQCAQKAGRMLVFVICGFIKNFLTNSYFILHIHHVKSFKMRHVRYFNFSVRYS